MLTILTPCRNERENVEAIADAVARCIRSLAEPVDYQHLFIDNDSTDGTVDELRKLAAKNHTIAVIINQRNFGHVRSPFYGLLSAKGEAVIVLAADFQDPPELISRFIQKWRDGFPVVLGQKANAEESPLLSLLRRA